MRIRRDKLDVLFSEFIRKRDKVCQRCGKATNGWKGLHCAHFHTRSKRSVRWDEDNAVALCFGCHQYIDSHPQEKIDFFKEKLGEDRFTMLEHRMKMTHPKPDKVLLELYYKNKINEAHKPI